MGHHTEILEIAGSDPPSRAGHSAAPALGSDIPPAHSILFYEDDSVFVDDLARFAATALDGGACLVIATAPHLDALLDRLEQSRIDFQASIQSQKLILLDAKETLTRFLVEGSLRRDLFFRAIESHLDRARRALEPGLGAVSAFGEMVAVLWDEGKCETAIQLEELWNELVPMQRISLRCAYPMRAFAGARQLELIDRVCGQHGRVIPAESYTLIHSESERLRMISSLQRKAKSLHWAEQERRHEAELRRDAEVRMRRSEEFARQILESGSDCVKVIDLAGRLEYINPAGLAAMEIQDPIQILGKSWVHWWREEDRAQVEAALAAARSGGVGSFQADCATGSGAPRSWDVRITPVRPAEGKIEHLVAVSRDITELRQAHQALLQAERVAAAGRMAATIAHEINNPLEAVTNLIYLARLTPGLSQELCHRLEAADRELADVAQIARRTLSFYRDQARSCWFAAADCVADVLAIYDRKMRNTGIQPSLSIEPGLKIYWKPGEMRQVLANLIRNAIDASDRGGTIWIRAQTSRDLQHLHPHANGAERRKGVRITLADNGSGMSPEVKKRLFTPFFSTKAGNGNGIGLWISKSLVEQQGGFLRVRSRQGDKSGTVISIFIPVPDAEG